VTIVSKYGNRNVTTRTNDLQNPRLLAASSSNEEEKAHMQQLLDDFATKSTSIKEEVRDRFSSGSHTGCVVLIVQWHSDQRAQGPRA
jgi:hypothetical protein